MSTSTITKTLTELKAEAAIITSDYNRALNHPLAGDNVGEIKDKLDKAIEAYNNESKRLTFTALRMNDSPMLAAVKKLNFETIKTKTEKNTMTGIVTFKIEDSEQQIRLTEFDKFCEWKASADSTWTDILSKFFLLATYKNCVDMGEKMNDVKKRLEQTYQISQVAKDIDMGKTPLSQTQMVKNLQTLLDAVVGKDILKVVPKDLMYVYKLMNKRGGCGVIISPRPQTMEVLLMDVLHNVISHKSYVVSYQQKKTSAPVPGGETDAITDDTTTDTNDADTATDDIVDDTNI